MFDLERNLELIKNTTKKGALFSLDYSGVSDNDLGALVTALNANANITKLSLAATNIADSTCALGKLEYVKELNVSQTSFSSDALVAVCQCEQLTKLTLGTKQLTENTVQQLKAVVRRRALELVFNGTRDKQQQQRRDEVVDHFTSAQQPGVFHVSSADPTVGNRETATLQHRSGILTSCCQRLMNFPNSPGTPGGKEPESPLAYVRRIIGGNQQ